jgi:hypothetical protein
MVQKKQSINYLSETNETVHFPILVAFGVDDTLNATTAALK